jgi:5-methyltetrahydrofolate--homocysteine methyltransferase
MNQIFMTKAIARGLEGATIDPLDQRMMASIIADAAMPGWDNFCRNYLKGFRSSVFD